jgi:hypothetical protein
MNRKLAKHISEQFGISLRLINSVCKQLGEDNTDNLSDIANHGADAGFPGFTYYADTCKFFKKHRKEIVELVKNRAEDFGQSPIDFVASFVCLKDMATKEEIAKVLYGRLNDDTYLVENDLSWFVLEEVARAYEDGKDS